ncbi:MAG: adenine phosphoribosyltransferase [Myxococcota bacterium]
MATVTTEIAKVIRDIPDFPKPGILFKDITPIFQHPNLLKRLIDELAVHYSSQNIEAVVGMESRGFLFGVPLALALDVPFVLARKKGKLPADTVEYSYDLEYGQATLELHSDSLKPNQNVLIIDDLLATGGTAKATQALVEKLGATVSGFAFVIELDFLNGREHLNAPVHSIVHY